MVIYVTSQWPNVWSCDYNDLISVMQESAKHYAIAAKLDRPFKFEDQETFVAQ